MSVRSVLALVVLSTGLFAQDRATLTGIVTDPSGAAIPNASIKATNTATNTTSETKTTVDGVYAIPYLFPGVYNIEISAPGFQALKREGITLDAAKKLAGPVS